MMASVQTLSPPGYLPGHVAQLVLSLSKEPPLLRGLRSPACYSAKRRFAAKHESQGEVASAVSRRAEAPKPPAAAGVAARDAGLVFYQGTFETQGDGWAEA